MTAKTELSAPKRRTRAEVQQLVAEFVSSGLRRSEFCQSRGLSFSTLDRHLKKLRWKRRRKPIFSAGRLVPVDLASRKSSKQHEPGWQWCCRAGAGSRCILILIRVRSNAWWASWPRPFSCFPGEVRGAGNTAKLAPNFVLPPRIYA